MAQTATNRFKYLLASGGIVPGTTDIRMGLLGGQALTGTEHAAVPDLNTVADLLAVSGVDELTGVASYARQALTGEAASEVDGSDWALIDSDNVAFGNLETGDTIYGCFLYVEGGNDGARNLLSVHDLLPTPTNGGSITVTTGSGVAKIT